MLSCADLYLLRLDLGRVKRVDEVDVVDRTALGRTESHQDAVLDLLQLLLHLGTAHDQLALRFLQVRPLLRNHDAQQLVLQPATSASLAAVLKKGKVFPYSLPSVGPGADPGVQAVSPQVT